MPVAPKPPGPGGRAGGEGGGGGGSLRTSTPRRLLSSLTEFQLQAEVFASGFLCAMRDETAQGCFRAAGWAEAGAILASWGPGVDARGLCGGRARSAQVATRRQLNAGKNFDLVTNCHFGPPMG